VYLPDFLGGFDRLVAFDAETTGKRTPDAEFVRKQPFAWKAPGIIIEVGFVEMLAATSPGAIMVPGSPRVLWKMATPRRYIDKGFMRTVAPAIYWGAFRENPQLIEAHAEAMGGASGRGYLYQVIAMTGWTSLPWLWTLKQPALILAGTDDPIIPIINARVMARLMPNRLEILEDGHLFLVTRPVETAVIIESFLAE
jgi:pimeloyl-ACP methyl ester carboxylesterase